MSSICLMLSGVALLINGLGLLGRVGVRDSAVFNTLVGGVQLILAVQIAVAADGDAELLLDVSAIFLFGITYLYVGLGVLLGLNSSGVGWYCGFVACMGVFYALHNYSTDLVLSTLWLGWASLWGLFFLVLALDKTELVMFTAWVALLMSPLTTTLPAILDLSMRWPTGRLWAATAGVVIALIFIVAALLTKRGYGARDISPADADNH